jgi:murein DD-endopeptidase MepM/ murein hydrolase activator NlpD
MSPGAQWKRFADRLAVAKERWFPERQIILRERDRLHALKLTSNLQTVVAAAVAGGILWSLYASAGYLVNSSLLTRSESEIERTRVAYHELIDEVAAQHSKVLGITRDLEYYRSYLLTMVEQNETLQLDVRSFASQLETAEAEKGRVAAAESALRGQLREVARELSGVSDRNENLQVDVTHMRSRLASSEDEQARFAAVRAALDRRLTKLEQDLTSAQNKASELEKTAGNKQQLLDQAQAARRTAMAERDQLAQKAAEAEKSMKAMTVAHEQAISRLTEQTRGSIAEVERIVSATGLDPKRLLPQKGPAEKARAGRGGPFVPWREGAENQTAAPAGAGTAALHSDIERLDQLRLLLRAVPLAVPLKEFGIGSTFGRRLDPFNGQLALHEGLDMTAPRNTRVSVTAAGKVTFAGWRAAYGRVVEVEHGFGISTRYAHLEKIEVAEGDRVNLRQEIGLVGNSGRSSGTHLHYEVLINGVPQNPANFLKASANVLKGK